MNILNLVKITPLLLSNIVVLNTNEQQKLFSFTTNITNENQKEYFIVNTNIDTWSNEILNITYSTYNDHYIIKKENQNQNYKLDITYDNSINFEITFKVGTNNEYINITRNNENIHLDKSGQKFIVRFQVSKTELNPDTTYNYEIFLNNEIQPNPPEPDPPNNQYKDYNTYELNQSKLKAINIPANFSSYINENYNYIKFTNDSFTLKINKNQKATIYYTNKYITLPILGTFFNNNIQYNILDFYILDKDKNIVNLLKTITNNKIVSSARRTNINDIYSGNCNSLNALFDNNTYADNYTYTYENNTIKINEGTPIGNASIIANDKQVDPYATSLFGINPLTKSYFGLNNRLYITQNVQSTLISSFTSQYVFWNYTQYMPIFSFSDTDTSQRNKLNTTTLNINLSNNYDVYVIAFPTDTNNDVSLNVNDITTIIGAMDNLENIGLLPFTFGSIILIGIMLGFIMILIKILK